MCLCVCMCVIIEIDVYKVKSLARRETEHKLSILNSTFMTTWLEGYG